MKLFCILKVTEERGVGSASVSQRYGSGIRTKMSRIPNTDSGIGQYDVPRLPQKWYHPPELDVVNDRE
jgi:hypothetical protein